MTRHCPYCGIPRLDELPIFCNSECENNYKKWTKKGVRSKRSKKELLKAHVITEWDGNVWAIEGHGFISERLAEEYCKGDDTLRYKTIAIDTSRG